MNSLPKSGTLDYERVANDQYTDMPKAGASKWDDAREGEADKLNSYKRKVRRWDKKY